jgi:hypothetical protein
MALGQKGLLSRIGAARQFDLRGERPRDADRRARSASSRRVSSRAITAPRVTPRPSRTRTSAIVPPSSKPSAASCSGFELAGEPPGHDQVIDDLETVGRHGRQRCGIRNDGRGALRADNTP